MTATTSYAPSTAPSTPRRSASARTAWVAVGLVLAIATIAYATINVVDAFAYTPQKFTRTLSGPVTDVEISNDAGSVHIKTTTSDTVTVAGNGFRGLREPKHHETLRDGHLDIGASCPFSFTSLCRMHLTVTVPDDAPITVRAGGGGITIDGTTVAVDASSSGGGVTVNGAGGPLDLHASGGGITANDVRSADVTASSSGGGVKLFFAAPPENVHVSSSGGGVTVTLPNTADAYRLDVSSSGGGTHRDVRSDPASDRVIEAHSSGGGVTVRYGP